MRGPKLGWFRGLYRYYKDPSASPLGKLVVVLAAIYVVLPVDLIPDVPIVGWLDDMGVMGLAAAWLARKAAVYRRPDGGALTADAESQLDRRSLSPASSP